MLQQMRTKMKVIWVAAIVVPFIFSFVYLLQGRHASGSGAQREVNTVAIVNGRKVPYDMYSRYVNQLVENQRRQSNGRDVPSQLYDQLESQAWEEILSQELLTQEAVRLGIQVPDDEIVGMITQSPPGFIRQRFSNEKGEFDQAAFQRAVNDPNYPWLQDEMYLRAILPTLKLQQMVRAQASVSEEAVRREFARRTQRTKVHYAGVALGAIDLGGWTPSETELRQWYDSHLDRYSRGETAVLDLVRLDKKPSASDEAELVKDLKQVVQEARSDTLRTLVARNEAFAELARQHSEDPMSEKGGDIGWVTGPGQVAPQIQAAAATLQPGETSDVVRTETAWYVVHADSVRTAGSGGREMRLRQVYLEAKPSADTLDSLRTRVLDAASKAKQDFEGLARSLGSKVERLDPIQEGGFIPGVGYAKRTVDWAFRAKPGDVSEPAATDAAYYIARLVEKRPKGPLPYDQVKDGLKGFVEKERKTEKARAQVERVAARVAQGATLAAAAQAEGLKLEDPAPFSYFESVAGVGSGNEFSAVGAALAPGQTSGVITTDDGCYVLEVLSRDPFDETKYAAQRQEQYQNLLSRRENEVYDAWYKSLREHASVVDHRAPRV